MNDTKNPGDKTLHVSPKTLSLKRPVEQGVVRQSFSHGRSKAVVVETVKRRPVAPGGAVEHKAAPPQAAAPAPAAPKVAPQGRGGRGGPASNAPRSGVVLRTLSDQERDARANALADARRREEEDRIRQEDEARRRAEREAAEAQEREAAEARKREDEERRRHEDERKRVAEDQARRRLGEEAVPVSAPRRPRLRLRQSRPVAVRPSGGGERPLRRSRPPSGRRRRRPRAGYRRSALRRRHRRRPSAEPQPHGPPGSAGRARSDHREAEHPLGGARGRTPRDHRGRGRRRAHPPSRRGGKARHRAQGSQGRPGEEKRRGRLTVTAATSGEDERTRSVASFRRRNQRLTGHRQVEQKEKIAREVIIPETITIQELANRMSERAVDVIKMLMKQGQMHKITDVIDVGHAPS